MKRPYLLPLSLLAAALSLGACTADDDADLAPNTETTALGERVRVTLHVQTADPDAEGEDEGETRAKAPLATDCENLIYDLWLLQYTDEGNYALLASAEHLRTTVGADGGTTSITFSASLLARQSYLCVVANRGGNSQNFSTLFDAGADTTLYQTYAGYCEAMVGLDLPSFNDGTATRMLMGGYWAGTPTDGQQLTVPLSRLMTRLNVTIENNTGTAFLIDEEARTDNALEVSITNAPRMVYLYPSVAHSALSEADYTTLTPDKIQLAKGAKTTLYYYVAPNFCDQADRATTLNLRTADNNHTASIVLGTDAPGTDNRNLNLYPNTTYNFTITLTEKKAEVEEEETPAETGK
jgi:hypothetical protein